MSRWLSRRLNAAFLLSLFLVVGCSESTTSPNNENNEEEPGPQPTPDNPLDGFITVAPGVVLHYLDFGGGGDALLLLTGRGNSANVFRGFAPLFTDHYRVRALTRRGFGRSSKPADGYDRQTLAEDIRVFLDSIGVSTVHLVGHSLAGDEMSRFAADYPNRLGKLVYLDAAYDRTVTVDSTPAWAQLPVPTAADLASRSAFGAYLAGTLGVEFPSEEIAATTVVAADGSVVDFVTPPWVRDSLSAGVESPPYADVIASALGIYAVPQTPADIAPWLTPSSPDWSAAEAYLATIVRPAQEADRAKFDSEVQNSTLLEYDGANHYVFLWNPAGVANEVLGFLGGN